MDKHLLPNHSCEVCKPERSANSVLLGAELGRRAFFKSAGLGVTGYFFAPLAMTVKASAETTGAQLVGTARNVIFIHLQGAPSHVDTFDLKVGPWTPANFNPTTYNGVLFPQGLMPGLAEHMGKIAIIRSVRAAALVHELQQVWTQIARNPTVLASKIAPNIGSVVAREFDSQRKPHQLLPGFVVLNGGNTVGSGYFDARYTPFSPTPTSEGLAGLVNPAGQAAFERRFQILMDLDGELRANSPLGEEVSDIDGFYRQSHALMYNPQVNEAFQATPEDQGRYGAGFGSALIVARNLVKADLGTRFIQINLGGWDNHTEIYQTIRPSAGALDRGLGALLNDLSVLPGVNGGTLLDETLIVVMGEFGRTVGALNTQNGRDHYFQHFTVFAGGGVNGGRVIGKTNDDGSGIVEPGWAQNRAVVNEDIAATIYSALGIDYTKKLRDDPLQRGFEYVPFAAQGAWGPVLELFGRQLQERRSPISPRGPRRIG